MTTFQDQPPQSRRALRQQELSERARAEEIDDSAEADRVPSGRRARAAASEGLVEVPNADAGSADAAVETPVLAQTSGVTETSGPADSAIPKAFPFAGQVEATSDEAGHSGFRLHDFNPDVSKDEPSNVEGFVSGDAPTVGYVSPYAEPEATIDSKPEPSFDSLFSDLLAPESDAVVDSEPVADEPVAEEPEAIDEPAIALGEPVEVAEPVALVSPVEIAQEERTLSRREWRAMRAAAEAAEAAKAAQAENGPQADEQPADAHTVDEQSADEQTQAEQPAPDAQIVFQEPNVIPPLVEPVAVRQTALSDAMAEFEALTREPQSEQASSEQASSEHANSEHADADESDIPPVEPAFHEPEAPVDIERAAPAVAELPKPSAASNTPFSFFPAPAAPIPAPPTSTAPNSTAPTSANPSDDDEISAYTPPIGHWSRQAELDDESQPFENTLSRDVGGGNVATTTNALVLPMIPQRDDFSSVLNATGEIMVTGTINLPGSVGSTGRDSRHYDDPEVDHLFDAFDNEIPNTDSAPVRAITAVSSHTATRSGIEPGRKQSNRVLTVLLVTAGVMAVSVLALLVAGFVFNIF